MTATAPPPPGAVEVFGTRLDLAVRYAGMLCDDGITRGVLGPREADRIWDRHLLNCAVLGALVPEGRTVLDLGSGAGLPGIPLLIARPDLAGELVEPMQRRVAFLDECVAELGLSARVVRGRAEELPRTSADIVVVRAVAPLDRLVLMAVPLLRPGGTLLAMKGRTAAEEMHAARPQLRRWPGTRMELVDAAAAGQTVRVVKVVRPTA